VLTFVENSSIYVIAKFSPPKEHAVIVMMRRKSLVSWNGRTQSHQTWFKWCFLSRPHRLCWFRLTRSVVRAQRHPICEARHKDPKIARFID